MKLDDLSHSDIRNLIGGSIYNKGKKYRSQVQEPIREGETLMAQVRGTRMYAVRVEFREGEFRSSCNCPYDWGPQCKHIGALLIRWVEDPSLFRNREVETLPPGRLKTNAVSHPKSAAPSKKPYWFTHDFFARLGDYREELHTVLSESMRVQDLRLIAKNRGWTIKGTSKTDIITQIMEKMQDPAEIHTYLHKLDEEHRHVLRAMMVVGDHSWVRDNHIETVATTWGSIRKHKNIGTYTRHFVEEGLAVDSSHSYAVSVDHVDLLVARHLPPMLVDVISPADDPDDTYQITLSSPMTFPHAANQLITLLGVEKIALRPPQPRPDIEKFHTYLQEWPYVERELAEMDRKGQLKQHDTPLPLTVPPPAYRLPSDAINKFAPLLNIEQSIDGLDFLIELLQEIELIQKGTPVKIWAKGKETYLKMDEMTQHATLVNGYFSLTSSYELWMMKRIDPGLTVKRRVERGHYGRQSPDEMTEQVTTMRRMVFRLLSNLPDGQWFDVMDVAKLLAHYWSNVNDYQFNKESWFYRHGSKKSSDSLWYITKGTKPIVDSFELQMLFLKGMLMRPLSWLGLADVAVRDNKMLFRLHGLGDLYFDRVGALGITDREVVTSGAGETAAPDITVLGTTITVNPSTISPAAHSYLSTVAKLKNAVPGKFEYTLDNITVHNTFESGKNGEQLIEKWHKLFDQPMPDSVREPFAQWWADYGRVRLYQDVTIIEFADEYAIEEMKLNTTLADVMVGQLSPKLVIIPKTAVSDLKQQLEKAGYTPKVTDEA